MFNKYKELKNILEELEYFEKEKKCVHTLKRKNTYSIDNEFIGKKRLIKEQNLVLYYINVNVIVEILLIIQLAIVKKIQVVVVGENQKKKFIK